MPAVAAADPKTFLSRGMGGIADASQYARYCWMRDRSIRPRVVSFGCAHGYEIAWALADYNGSEWVVPTQCEGCVGIETNAEYEPEFHKINPKAKFICQDIRQPIALPERSFNTAIVAEILEHLRPQEAHIVLEEAWRIADRIVITVPNGDGDNYAGGVVEAIEHSMIYTPSIFKAMLAPGPQLSTWYKGQGFKHRFKFEMETVADFLGVLITAAGPL